MTANLVTPCACLELGSSYEVHGGLKQSQAETLQLFEKEKHLLLAGCLKAPSKPGIQNLGLNTFQFKCYRC